jgi:hypothetical protein
VAPGLPVDDGNGQEDAENAAQDHREAACTDREKGRALVSLLVSQ